MNKKIFFIILILAVFLIAVGSTILVLDNNDKKLNKVTEPKEEIKSTEYKISSKYKCIKDEKNVLIDGKNLYGDNTISYSFQITDDNHIMPIELVLNNSVSNSEEFTRLEEYFNVDTGNNSYTKTIDNTNFSISFTSIGFISKNFKITDLFDITYLDELNEMGYICDSLN